MTQFGVAYGNRTVELSEVESSEFIPKVSSANPIADKDCLVLEMKSGKTLKIYGVAARTIWDLYNKYFVTVEVETK